MTGSNNFNTPFHNINKGLNYILDNLKLATKNCKIAKDCRLFQADTVSPPRSNKTRTDPE